MTHDRKQSIYRAKNGEVAVLLRMYNFSVEYKPGRLNVVADALTRRPDFESAAQSNVRLICMLLTIPRASLYSVALSGRTRTHRILTLYSQINIECGMVTAHPASHPTRDG